MMIVMLMIERAVFCSSMSIVDCFLSDFPCRIAENELKDGLQVLYFRDNLLYDGVVREIEPPDM